MLVERLKTLLYNAIVLLETDNDYDIEDILEELGMTSEEYDKIVYDMEDYVEARVKYLKAKEKVCPLDDEERYFLYENGDK